MRHRPAPRRSRWLRPAIAFAVIFTGIAAALVVRGKIDGAVLAAIVASIAAFVVIDQLVQEEPR